MAVSDVSDEKAALLHGSDVVELHEHFRFDALVSGTFVVLNSLICITGLVLAIYEPWGSQAYSFFLEPLQEQVDVLQNLPDMHLFWLIPSLYGGFNSMLIYYSSRLVDSTSLRGLLLTVSEHPSTRQHLTENFARNREMKLGNVVVTWIVAMAAVFLVMPQKYAIRCAGPACIYGFAFKLPQYIISETAALNVMDTCKRSIDTLVLLMLPDAEGKAGNEEVPLAERPVDWTRVAAAHHRLDLHLEAFWKNEGPWLFVPLLSGRGIFALLVFFLALSTSMPKLKIILFLIAGGMCIGTLLLLWPLAEVTERCKDSRAHAGCIRDELSVRAVANRYSGSRTMTSEERASHLQYISYANSAPTGVEFGGTLITKSLLLSMCYQFAASFPIIVALLQNAARNLEKRS